MYIFSTWVWHVVWAMENFGSEHHVSVVHADKSNCYICFYVSTLFSYIGSFDYNSNRHKSVYAYGLTFSACELSQGKTTFGIGGSVSRTVDQTFKFGSKIQKSLLELEKILHFEPPLAKHKL